MQIRGAPNQADDGVGTVRRREMWLGRDGLFPSLFWICTALAVRTTSACGSEGLFVFPGCPVEVTCARTVACESCDHCPGDLRALQSLSRRRWLVGTFVSLTSIESDSPLVTNVRFGQAYVPGLFEAYRLFRRGMCMIGDSDCLVAVPAGIQLARAPPALCS